jgi:Phasin protein
MAKNQQSSTVDVPNFDIAQAGRKQLEAMVELQKQFFDPQEISRGWAARARLEADLATEFGKGITTAKTIQEVASVCQEWMNRRMELFTEDSRRLVAETQKFMTAMTQVMSGGGKGGGS